MKPIFLMGFMGCGKSAVARSLARQLGVPFVDLDARIERQIGCSIASYFAQHGEDKFRELETQHLAQVASRRGVISLGGGVPMRAQNREVLDNAIDNGAMVVYLQTSAPVLAARIRRSPGKRPLIDGDGELSLEATQKRVEELLADREEIYLNCASLVVQTDKDTIPDIARRIARAYSDDSQFRYAG